MTTVPRPAADPNLDGIVAAFTAERPAAPRIRLDVYCGDRPGQDGNLYGCGSLLGTWYDQVRDKYPFWCESCQDTVTSRYPWTLVASIELPGAAVAPTSLAAQQGGRDG